MKNEHKTKIQKLIANTGHCSRRTAELLIQEGRVFANGKKVNIGDRYSDRDKISVDGRILIFDNVFRCENDRLIHILDKKIGEVCSKKDEKGRPSVFERLPKINNGRWIMVGRLDINSSGLLIFTNDGEYANYLMHPKNRIKRKYIAKVQGKLSNKHIDNLLNGVNLYDGHSKFNEVNVLNDSDKNMTLEVVASSGKNRIVRRMLESQGVRTVRLRRISYGDYSL